MKKGSRRLVVITLTPLLYFVVLTLLYAAYFTSNTGPFDTLKQHLSNWVVIPATIKVNDVVEEHKSLELLFGKLVTGEEKKQLEHIGFACHTAPYSDVCVANQVVRIDTHTMNIYLPSNQTLPPVQRMVRPYARQEDLDLMSKITPVHILLGHNNNNNNNNNNNSNSNLAQPACNYTHKVPVVIFSSGGFVGNQFHEINEIIIPLFLTTRHFKSRVQFIIVDYNPKFVSKYYRILSLLSNYEAINPATNGSSTASLHCFPGAIVGLHFHGQSALNSSDVPLGYSMPDFKQFLRKAYNLNKWTVSEMEKPILILISRVNSRTLLNEDEVVGLMEELGFRVIVARPKMMKNVDKFAQIVNSCSVMVGIHGAGLTNEVFLPIGAVVIQVVPLGLEWPAVTYYGEPLKAMGVHYLEYKIKSKESSLFKFHGRDHPIVADPASMGSKFGRIVYLNGQHVRIDLVRFRETLVEALGLLGPELT